MDTFMSLRRRQICISSGPLSPVQRSTPHDRMWRPEVLADVQRLTCPTRATLSPSRCPLCPDPARGHRQGRVHVLIHSWPFLLCDPRQLYSLSEPLAPPSPPRAKFPKAENAREQSSLKCLVPSKRGKWWLPQRRLSRSQDEMELGYVQAPHKTFPVVFDSPRNGELQDFPYKRILVSGPGGSPALGVHGHDSEGCGVQGVALGTAIFNNRSSVAR